MPWHRSADRQPETDPPRPARTARGGGALWPLLLLLTTALGLTACSTPSAETAVRTAFITHDRVAIVANLPREHEEFFIPYYMNSFPRQTLVERRDVTEVIDEQDLLPERLNDETRARLREILGVKAIVYPSASTGQFAIKVVDTATAEITASTIVSGRKLWSGDPLDDRRLIRMAIEALADRAASLEALSARLNPVNER